MWKNTNKNKLFLKIDAYQKNHKLLAMDFTFVLLVIILFFVYDKFGTGRIGPDNPAYEQSHKYAVDTAIVLDTILFLLYLAIRIPYKMHMKKFLSSIDFKKYEGLYREILNNISPAELSYIDDFELSYQNDIVATLLSLKLKNIIIMDDTNELIKVKPYDSSFDNLSDNEKYVLEHIIDGKLKNIDYSDFEDRVSIDLLRRDIVKKNKIDKRLHFLICFCATILTFVSYPVLLKIDPILDDIGVKVRAINGFFAIIDRIFPLVEAILPVALLFGIYSYCELHVSTKYYRNKKGENLNEKLEGLKNYLKDYSILSEKEQKDISLWEDYLLYSVIFRQNVDVVDNIWNKYVS